MRRRLEFLSTDRSENRTRFIQQERFTGLLVQPFARSLDEHTLSGFHAMNAALKTRAEAFTSAAFDRTPAVA